MVARDLSAKVAITDYARLRRAPRVPGHGGAFQARVGAALNAKADLTVPPRLADMIVTDITWSPASPAPGDHVVFSAVVQNIGSQPTPAGTVVDVLFTIGQGGVQVARTWEDNQTAAIAPGASVTMVANGGDVVGGNYWVATAGTYTVSALVNGNIRFPEADRSNNTRQESFSVGAASGTPSAPTLNAVPGNATVALTWNVPANNGSAITSYRVRRDGVILNPPNTTTTALAYTDNTVVNNVAYSYTVAAVNAVGEGPPSAPVVVTPFTGTGVPALPSDVLNATPASKLFGWGGLGQTPTGINGFDTWKNSFGFQGFSTHGGWYLLPTLESMAMQFYHPGSDVTALADPLLVSSTYNGTYAYEHSWLGYNSPLISGGTWGVKNVTPFGIGDYKRLHPTTFMFFIGLYLRNQSAGVNPYLGDWWDDTLWNGYARSISNWAAGVKYVGADGITFDMETSEGFEITGAPNSGTGTVTSTTRPANPLVGRLIYENDTGLYKRWTGTVWETRTFAEIQAKIEARGFQFGQGIYNANPDCQLMTYEWHIAGGAFQARIFGDSAYGVAIRMQDTFFYGIMRAMQVAGGAKSFLWRWDDGFYEPSWVTVPMIQRSQQNLMALVSQRVAPAVRDFIMTRFATMFSSWLGGNSPTDPVWPPIGEPAGRNHHERFRQYSGHGTGWRADYCQPSNNGQSVGGGPAGVTGSPAQNMYTDTRTNPPGGHAPGLLAATSTTPQDSTPIAVGAIAQSRAFNTVTLTFTAGHPFAGIRNVHWTLYASNGSTVAAQGEAVMVFNPNGGSNATNFNAAFMNCTCTIPNATAGLYVIIDAYSCVGQRTSRRVQLQ